MDALGAFCEEELGTPMDPSGVVVLQGSTAAKFSEHIIVRSFDIKNKKQPCAFVSNVDVGLIVKRFVRYVELHQCRKQSWRSLFVRGHGPKSQNVCVIDTSVYSRDRSFRLLFQSKYGKSSRFDLDPSCVPFVLSGDQRPAVALLFTMVSFVPSNAYVFKSAQCPKTVPSGAGRGASPRPLPQSTLVSYVVRCWDEVRKQHEPMQSHPQTFAQASVENGHVRVVLEGNRFCFRKGASHLKNRIYLVIDIHRNSFHQRLGCMLWVCLQDIDVVAGIKKSRTSEPRKCFDPNCCGFKSVPFDIPMPILQSDAIVKKLSMDRSRSPQTKVWAAAGLNPGT